MDSVAGNSTSNAAISVWPLLDLRTCFYFVHPHETFYEYPEHVPSFLFRSIYPWGLFLILLEIISLKMMGRTNEWRLHSAIVSYSSTAMFEGFGIFVLRDLELSTYEWIFDNMRLFTLPWNSLVTYGITLVAMEFGAYWWHRMSHELAIMWAAHELHHSSDDFNLSIAFRNSISIRFFKWIFYVPLAFFGVPSSIMLTHLVLGSIYNSTIHHNAIPKFRKIIPVLGHFIDFVFVTPSHHRVHHASNQYCIDKNYGQHTILWDRLFGTFQEEREDEELVFGTLTQPKSFDMATLQMSSYVKLWQKFQSMDTFTNKMKSLFYGPGWFPGTHRLGNPEDIPDVRGRQKFDPSYPTFISWYLAVNCFCIFYSYVNMSTRVQDLPTQIQLLNLAYIFTAYAAIGGIYDGKEYAAGLELARIIIFLGLSLNIPMLTPSIASNLVHYILYADLLAWPMLARYIYNQSWLNNEKTILNKGEFQTIYENVEVFGKTQSFKCADEK